MCACGVVNAAGEDAGDVDIGGGDVVGGCSQCGGVWLVVSVLRCVVTPVFMQARTELVMESAMRCLACLVLWGRARHQCTGGIPDLGIREV